MLSRKLTGVRFGRLTVKGVSGKDMQGRNTWECLCDCGLTVVVKGGNLTSGNSKSCGCLKNKPVRRDIRGVRFGRLVTEEIHEVKEGVVFWKCSCECGNKTVVTYAHLTTGHTRSCGCLVKETSRKLATELIRGKSGSNHPRWNPELTEEQRRGTRTAEDKAWSSAVLARDCYTCVVCRAKGRMHAHHLDQYSEHEDSRREMANGVCLCVECHKEFHKALGFKNITESKFYEYFGFPFPGPRSEFVEPFDISGMNDNLGNALKCIARAGKKGDAIEDLRKAAWYLNREIETRSANL